MTVQRAAEALTCAVRVHNRKAEQKDTVYVSELVPPSRRSVIYNYTQGGGIQVKTLRHNTDGTLDLDSLAQAAGSCGVYVEQPNPLGILDGGLTRVKEIIGDNTAFIVGVAPVSLGVVEAPGNYVADIVIGEGQALGSPITYGGPYGIFACTKAYLRQMPGRIVGRSIDVDGKAFCLTLSTREQHIRRHRATSNICTNETLIALMGAMHMSLLVQKDWQNLPREIWQRVNLRSKNCLKSLRLQFLINLIHFNEFVVELPSSAPECIAYLDTQGLIGGFDLSAWYPIGRIGYWCLLATRPRLLKSNC